MKGNFLVFYSIHNDECEAFKTSKFKTKIIPNLNSSHIVCVNHSLTTIDSVRQSEFANEDYD